MSNYDNINWTGAALNQKNREAALNYALSPEGQAYQKEYDMQARVGKAIAENEDLLNPGAFESNPIGGYEKASPSAWSRISDSLSSVGDSIKTKGIQGVGDTIKEVLGSLLSPKESDAPVYSSNPTGRYKSARPGVWRTDVTPNVQDIINYMVRNNTTSKSILEGARQGGDTIYRTTGNYSLSPEGKLSRDYSYNAEEIPDKKWYDVDFSWEGLGSLLSGGLTDIAKGQLPGTDWAKQGVLTEVINPAAQVHSMFTGGATDLVYGIDKAGKSGGSFWDKFGVAADRAIDPFGVDPATRATGEAIRDINPEAFDKNIAPYLPAVGAAIGTLIYPAAGTAGGYGIGTKLAQGQRNYDYLKDLATAATIYATYGAGSGAGSAVTSLTGSALLGGVTSGVISGAISSVPSAIQQRSWDPLWKGALAGGVAGGVGTGARIGAYGLGASKAIANLTGKTAGSLASTGMKNLWLKRNS